MRAHISNSAYGALDYIAQPLCMLLAAPMLLRHLGVAAYGVWLIASAAVSAGAIVSSGFGDAVIQRVATLRASNDLEQIRRVIANMLTINLVLGGTLAGLLWLLIPLAAARITHAEDHLYATCVWSLRVGSVLMVIKAVESVFISAQRAFERYAPAVRIGIATRILSIAAAVLFALHGFGVAALMISTATLTLIGAAVQGWVLRRHLGAGFMLPAFDRGISRQLLSFGGLTWLQAASGIIFSQVDRLLLGTTLGASAVAYYGVCVQMAQPIHGLTSAGLHFIFPHLAARSVAGANADLWVSVLKAFLVNVLAAGMLMGGVLIAGPWVLSRWVGPVFANASRELLPLIAFGFGLMALNITAHYTLMALGWVGTVTGANVCGGVLMLVAMMLLVPHRGVEGAALARLWYGLTTCLMYVPLLRLTREPTVMPGVQAEVERA